MFTQIEYTLAHTARDKMMTIGKLCEADLPKILDNLNS